jgi:L-alanine-DL-glutamate epimerase-like enolase superfamily enzyme
MNSAVENMTLGVSHESWPLAHVFTISRGSKTHADVVVVTLSRDGITGRGECVPYPRYNETVPHVLAALDAARPQIEQQISLPGIAALPLPYAARNALDCALWDWTCKRDNTPAWQRAGLADPTPLTTAYTISLDEPAAMAAAAKAAQRPLLKLKLGRPGDETRLHAIRAAVPDARLIVDANEGWSPDILPTMLRTCHQARVELVEQPLPAGDDDALRGLSRDCLICADESAHGLESLPDLAGKYDAINIKLDKTGGLTPALELARAASSHRLKIMVGCMVATSLAMAPATLIGQLALYVDLDGPLLLRQDRDNGIHFDGATMQPPPRALWG